MNQKHKNSLFSSVLATWGQSPLGLCLKLFNTVSLKEKQLCIQLSYKTKPIPIKSTVNDFILLIH